MKLILITLILATAVLLFADAAVAATDELREYLEAQTRYWGIQDQVSAEDMNQLVELKRKADQAGLNLEERTAAYTNLFLFVQRLRGIPQGRVPASFAALYWTEGQSALFPALPSPTEGELGSVVKAGKGSIPMILLPDLGMDPSVFNSFVKRHEKEFTFYEVTLAGFAGTSPPRRPERLDFSAQGWWENAARAILNLIRKEKLVRPLILGHQAGAYPAMKIALQDPGLLRGVIVLNGLLRMNLPGIPADATPADRVRIVNSMMPIELFPYPSREHYAMVMMQNGGWFCKDPERQKFLTNLVAATRPDSSWNYFVELVATDLSEPIKSLKTPMLVLPSVYDSGYAPGVESSKTALAQWDPLDHSKSSLPITVVHIEDCRAYATEDQPEKLDEAIRNWVAALPAI